MTVTATSGSSTSVSSCAATCTVSSITVLGVKSTTTCCQTNLCNGATCTKMYLCNLFTCELTYSCNGSTNINAAKIMIAFLLVLVIRILGLFKD